METEFHIGDIVWVKIKGYPWWPGIIKSIILNDTSSNKGKKKPGIDNNHPHKYIIKFFIELTESIISDITKIKPYVKYKDEFSKIKQKKLIHAIKFANLISSGKMTFDQHYSFIKEGLRTYEEQCRKLEEIKNGGNKEDNKEINAEKESEKIEDNIINEGDNNIDDIDTREKKY